MAFTSYHGDEARLISFIEEDYKVESEFYLYLSLNEKKCIDVLGIFRDITLHIMRYFFKHRFKFISVWMWWRL